MNNGFRISLPVGAHYRACKDENLLAAAQRAHWLVRYGCRNGNCDACAAALLEGKVCDGNDNVIEAPAEKILLCQCRALSDLQIALPNDPRAGSIDQSLRCYAHLQHRQITDNASILSFTLPAGRKPPLLADQIALIETASGLLQGRIDHKNSHDRKLVITLVCELPLQQGTYYYLRYPLNSDSMPTGSYASKPK